LHPVKSVGFGARHHRQTGNQYDFFSVDFEYENGMHVHSMCRQINDCVNNVSEFIQGSKGTSNAKNMIKSLNGDVIWKYKYPMDEEGKETSSPKISPYVQEHIDLVTAIRNNTAYVEAENTAISTMAAIMGRMSAYTGKEVTWDEVMNSDFTIGPKEYSLGKVDVDKTIPVPGSV